ncbi:hypothetical protein EYF80_027421 [Liparis tanakae]|uniref:Uncharacterized protein n=1 Tax=Liparis tanakae TaxID=230148 RepID=A0A4Z2H9S0_9TELE|nr:hypothetical protein EYF80_027421 [Liparis tanakae]
MLLVEKGHNEHQQGSNTGPCHRLKYVCWHRLPLLIKQTFVVVCKGGRCAGDRCTAGEVIALAAGRLIQVAVMHPSTTPSPASLQGSISFNSSYHQLISHHQPAVRVTVRLSSDNNALSSVFHDMGSSLLTDDAAWDYTPVIKRSSWDDIVNLHLRPSVSSRTEIEL